MATRAAVLPVVMVVAVATCAPSPGHGVEKPVASDDARASAIVQLVAGGRSVDNRMLPTTSPNCTGVLVTPRVVLSAAHCFGTGAPGDGTRKGLQGGDPSCVLRDATGAVVATGGCGEVVFTDVLGQVREVQPVRRVLVNAGQPPSSTSHARDLALLVLDHRATPRTAARATPIRPWLDADLDLGAWKTKPNVYYGWGRDGTQVSGDGDCGAFLNGSESTTVLHHWDESPLDSNTPLVRSPIDGPDEAGLMFLQQFDPFGDTSGFNLPGDSGGPILMTDAAGETRVAGVASLHWCETTPIGCFGPREAGTLQNLWARTMDDASGNRAFLQAALVMPDGSLYGDDVPSPGCAATPPTPDPGDPDCDGVPTTGTAWRPADDCPTTFDPAQIDGDGDGRGDACDDDDHVEPW